VKQKPAWSEVRLIQAVGRLHHRQAAIETIVKPRLFESGMRLLRGAGPYLLVELLLPGGTLLAFLLWLWSGVSRGQLADVRPLPVDPISIERVICVCIPA
jgi:hypothetical protein